MLGPEMLLLKSELWVPPEKNLNGSAQIYTYFFFKKITSNGSKKQDVVQAELLPVFSVN